jgi:metallo-beta-lactamase class B
MKQSAIGLLAALTLVIGGVKMIAQSRADTVEAHVAAAKAAAGQEHVFLFNSLCAEPAPATQQNRAPAPPSGPPDRSQWHAEPVKVFDNLYFVGQTEYSAWAVTTSQGIIIIDTIWDYSVEDEIVGGLTKLGFDPREIKYAIVSHGHIDHAGGAKYLQDHFGTRVILSAVDWDLLGRDTGAWPKPKRDMVASDGQRLTLGDTTLTLYLTPGHTLGTISTLIPVKDAGKPHLVAEWGGTAFNWIANRRG